MVTTVNDLKASLDRLYQASYDLRAQRMEAEYTIQELEAEEGEDNHDLITRISKAVDKCYETENQVNDHIKTVKAAIKVAEEGVDTTWVVW